MKRISPATVIASVALFFSLAGAGMAASGYRITSIWQIAPNVRHALRGERGPQGIPGRPGTPGAQGAQGIQGPAGPPAPADWDLNDKAAVLVCILNPGTSGEALATGSGCDGISGAIQVLAPIP